jgi:hypothetical protein
LIEAHVITARIRRPPSRRGLNGKMASTSVDLNWPYQKPGWFPLVAKNRKYEVINRRPYDKPPVVKIGSLLRQHSMKSRLTTIPATKVEGMAKTASIFYANRAALPRAICASL